MKNSLAFLLVLITAIFLFSCSDSKTEAEYYKIAYDQYNDGKYEVSIKNFKSLVEEYPKGENTPNTIFMIGFIHANHLKNMMKQKNIIICLWKNIRNMS